MRENKNNDLSLARKYLSRARFIGVEIESLREARRQAWEYATRVTAEYGDGERVRSAAEKKMAEYAGYAGLIESKIDELYRVSAEIEKAISALDEAEQSVLRMHYIQCMPFWKVGAMLSYSERQVRRINKRALFKIADLLKKERGV